MEPNTQRTLDDLKYVKSRKAEIKEYGFSGIGYWSCCGNSNYYIKLNIDEIEEILNKRLTKLK